MKAHAGVRAAVFGLTATALGGCATYYEPYELMDNQQIIAASCAQLAEETDKLNSNVAASNEGVWIGAFGAAALGAGEYYAGTDGSATAEMVDTAYTSGDLGTNWQARLDLVNRVKARKGCY
jgi:hypothetical protein